MARVHDIEFRYWRTDFKRGRGIYVLVSNDVLAPSELDPLIGVMESSEIAENVVDTHNQALRMFGRRYLERLTG